MSLTSLKESDVGKSIMSALKKIGGSAGASLEDIKEYLTSKLDKAPDMESVKTWLNGAVDKGIVSLSGGKYKLKEAKEYAQQAGQAIASKVINSKDKMKDSAGSAEKVDEFLKESDIGKCTMSALKKIGGSAGASLEDIKGCLTSKMDKAPDMESVKTWLNGAVDKGIVSLSDGKYKLKDAKEYAQQAGQAIASKVTNSKDKMKDSAGSAEKVDEFLKESDIGKCTMSALKKIGGSAGASLEDIKGCLTSKMDKAPDMESVKTWLNGAVDKGIVSLSDGKYKLKDAKEYAQQAGQAIASKVTNSKDKMKDSAGSAEKVDEFLKESDIGKCTMSALKKIGGSAGASLEDIKGCLTSKMDKAPDMESVKTWLNGAVDKGIVSLSDGKYKLKDANEYAQQTGQAIVSKVTNSKDKLKDSAGRAEEADEEKEKNEETANLPFFW